MQSFVSFQLTTSIKMRLFKALRSGGGWKLSIISLKFRRTFPNCFSCIKAIKIKESSPKSIEIVNKFLKCKKNKPHNLFNKSSFPTATLNSIIATLSLKCSNSNLIKKKSQKESGIHRCA